MTILWKKKKKKKKKKWNLFWKSAFYVLTQQHHFQQFSLGGNIRLFLELTRIKLFFYAQVVAKKWFCIKSWQKFTNILHMCKAQGKERFSKRCRKESRYVNLTVHMTEGTLHLIHLIISCDCKETEQFHFRLLINGIAFSHWTCIWIYAMNLWTNKTDTGLRRKTWCLLAP